ncbi:oxygenase MpaB family protein [Roseivirga misakiensis]|uniref:ER-bound oxygenase mpaB/mpaB'/Rubber oxygenase catalytic domain-containing protein n=1 Tax=Roseivirga misakiensis TaxID=1563681 RepID=A0A1E5T086_9BACT|nr:oxygenase MpaB family protein [Roseivirga misakiensis]OEK04783.1 hypothetical protein BFP71_15165 [Roseivirga misakiensis]
MKYSEDILDSLRFKQDELADKVIQQYFPQKKALLQEQLQGLVNNTDELSSNADQSLVDLLTSMRKQIDQLDEGVLAEGQAFFDEFASDIMLLLGFMSLPYCYAAKNGAEVLVRSNRILENPAQRLNDTAEFVFDVTHKNAFKPEGKALMSILKVRLMHAATRWYVSKDKTWDNKKFGAPVNQEDMAGTNLSFSLLTIRGLRKLGKLMTAESAFGYINYWNKIGELLGLDPLLLPENNREAAVLERKIRQRQFGYSEAGKTLTMSLLKYYEFATINSPLEGKVKTFMNFLIGNYISNMIGLEINDFDRAVFKPYQLFLGFRNYFFNTQDSYAAAYTRFKETKL